MLLGDHGIAGSHEAAAQIIVALGGIVVYKGASGRTDGMVRSYDFLAHRVPELTNSKAFSYEYHPIQNLGVTDCVFVRQQAALAEAIREILGEDYYIEYKDDGRIVVMRLKPTKHF